MAMQLHMIAVGRRMPTWVVDAVDAYRKRFPPHCRLQLVEIAAGRRSKGADLARINRDEGERLLAAVPAGARVIALERRGHELDTAQLADQLRGWLEQGRDVVFLIGGPEGLAGPCLDRADAVWSLSRLTLAHPVARVVMAEQLYRAWSVVAGLPYHRDD